MSSSAPIPERQPSLEDIVKVYPTHYSKKFWSSFLKHFRREPHARIVDLGCGPGLWLRDITKQLDVQSVTGFDRNPQALEYARNLLQQAGVSNFTLHCTDLERGELPKDLPFHDLGFMGFVLHEFNNPLRALEAVRSLIRPWGFLVIYDFCRTSLKDFLSYLTEREGFTEDRAFSKIPHWGKYAPEDIAYLLTRAGYMQPRYEWISPIRVLIWARRQ